MRGGVTIYFKGEKLILTFRIPHDARARGTSRFPYGASWAGDRLRLRSQLEHPIAEANIIARRRGRERQGMPGNGAER